MKESEGNLLVQLPPPDELDALIGSSQWMVKQATASALGRNAATKIEIVGPDGAIDEDKKAAGNKCGDVESGNACGSNKLEW